MQGASDCGVVCIEGVLEPGGTPLFVRSMMDGVEESKEEMLDDVAAYAISRAWRAKAARPHLARAWCVWARHLVARVERPWEAIRAAKQRAIYFAKLRAKAARSAGPGASATQSLAETMCMIQTQKMRANGWGTRPAAIPQRLLDLQAEQEKARRVLFGEHARRALGVKAKRERELARQREAEFQAAAVAAATPLALAAAAALCPPPCPGAECPVAFSGEHAVMPLHLRCQAQGCSEFTAKRGGKFCRAHVGGSSPCCQFGCTKAAVAGGLPHHCKAHGGGYRCVCGAPARMKNWSCGACKKRIAAEQAAAQAAEDA